MKDIYGGANARQVKKLAKIAKLVEDKEQLYLDMSDEQLAAQTQILRERYNAGETLDDILPDAFAVCREASARVLNQRHYHVQILGGIALHQGRICQMATGEGKTLTETLPAYLNALTGKGVHIITVNEYLATRDKGWMGKVFKFLGLTVGVTLANQTDREKRLAYRCDITYGTNSEFGFDYLRDNMAISRAQCVQRELNFVIIDEVDSILIDEARTPLIISGPSGKSSTMYVTANKFVCTLQNSTNTDDEGKTEDKSIEPNGDYVVDRKEKSIRLTDKGIAKAERFFKINNLSDPDNIELNNFINNALRAHGLMKRDDDYIVERGKVVIIDSFTGRKMEGRRFSNGLHQAIEAKEHVTIKEENKTLATITLQNYFRLYHKLSGMTGTAKTEEEEFNTIYNVDVVCIPTNLPLARVDENDYVYSTRAGKMRAIVNKIKQLNAKGQPILVGTVTVEKSEELSAMLTAQGVKHNVLNAKNHKREAEIVAQAGRLGAVTIATNMAGRGTDIKLGGNPEFRARKRAGTSATEQQFEAALKIEREKWLADYEEVKNLGGLYVMGTERHESRRIDNQLRGRSGRQGDPGRSKFYISMDDDLMRLFGGEKMKSIMSRIGMEPGEPINHPWLNKGIEKAQKKVEERNFEIRKHLLEYDDVLNEQR
ncbi:MAG: preprotein translocase subunit SecA, partial [Clostridia bacterium]|nr:preprotein translocase subunit SecA [Clostridia bacterium]